MENTLIRTDRLTRKLRPESPEMSVKDALDIAGPLSTPSKMPGKGYGLPARECAMGSKLRSVKGSVCEGCYAMKGNYMFTNVQRSQYARLDAIENPAWVDAMVTLIVDAVDPANPYFRWHDSGDLQSVDHLRAIVEIATRTPWVKYWIPTREFQIVARFRADGGEVPANLTIRLSAHMVDGKTPDGYGFPVSGVYREWEVYTAINPDSLKCPAPTQGNECGDCRTCWNSDARSVSYHKH